MRDIVTTTNPEYMYLVEGGRWLLVAYSTGSVTYFDLDASKSTEIILIPDQFDYLYRRSVSMAIDRDCDSPFLTFNLVLTFCANSTLVRTPEEQGIQIWRVTLALDNQQQGIGLTTFRLASFPLEYFIRRVYTSSICGPHLAISFICDAHHNHNQLTFVIDWKRAHGGLPDYPRHLIRSRRRNEPVCLAFLIF